MRQTIRELITFATVATAVAACSRPAPAKATETVSGRPQQSITPAESAMAYRGAAQNDSGMVLVAKLQMQRAQDSMEAAGATPLAIAQSPLLAKLSFTVDTLQSRSDASTRRLNQFLSGRRMP